MSGVTTSTTAGLLFLFEIAIATTGSAQPSAAPGSPVTAFVNVRVVPMDHDDVQRGQTVIVRGDRIAEIGPSSALLEQRLARLRLLP
jgi:hypothetical protein